MAKKKVTKGTKRTVIIYLAILVVLGAIIYAVPQVSDIFKNSYIAEYGNLQIVDEAKCLFVRDENVIFAKSAGKVEKTIEEGQIVRKGKAAASVGSSDCIAEDKGIVSYWYDGYEDKITPEKIDEIGSSIFDEIENSEDYALVEIGKGSVASGDPVVKIVDNHEWFLVCWLDEKNLEKYSVGMTVAAGFGEKESDAYVEVKMTVDSVGKVKDKKFKLVLSCDRYYEDFHKTRVAKCRIITSNNNGILLETDSIVEVDGVKGVYVIDKLGNNNFTPIYILAVDGDTTVVENNYFYDAEGRPQETVINYDEILRVDEVEE